MSHYEERATTMAQRAFLLVMALTMTALSSIIGATDPWALLLFFPMTAFTWLIVHANWKLTGCGEQEWHDYR